MLNCVDQQGPRPHTVSIGSSHSTEQMICGLHLARVLTWCPDKVSESCHPATLGSAPWTDEPGSHLCGAQSGHLATATAAWPTLGSWTENKLLTSLTTYIYVQSQTKVQNHLNVIEGKQKVIKKKK